MHNANGYNRTIKLHATIRQPPQVSHKTTQRVQVTIHMRTIKLHTTQ